MQYVRNLYLNIKHICTYKLTVNQRYGTVSNEAYLEKIQPNDRYVLFTMEAYCSRGMTETLTTQYKLIHKINDGILKRFITRGL